MFRGYLSIECIHIIYRIWYVLNMIVVDYVYIEFTIPSVVTYLFSVHFMLCVHLSID